MGIKVVKILFVVSFCVANLCAMDNKEMVQRDPVMDELEIGVYENIEKLTQEYAQIYVNKLSKYLETANKKDKKLTKEVKREMVGNVQQQLLAMAKKKSTSRKLANRFEQFANFVTAAKKGKRSVDSEKLSNDGLQDEAKQLIGLMHLLQQQSLDKVTQLTDKKELLKQKATELQENIEQKVQTIGEKAKTIKKRTIAGIGGTIVAFLSGGGLNAISDLISKFTSNNCQLKTNCQSLVAQNGSLTELETFCAGIISSCK